MNFQTSPRASSHPPWDPQEAAAPILETLPATAYSDNSSRPRLQISQHGRAFTLHDGMDLDLESTASTTTPKTPAYSDNISPTTEYSFVGNAVQESQCSPLPPGIPTNNSRAIACRDGHDAPPPPETPFIPPNTPDTTLVCSVSYPSSEIRAMAEALHQARQTGEFPETQGSLYDANIVVKDYAMLTELRRARGNPANPPPSTYLRLRVDVARRLQERDAEAEVAAARAEAERRVNSYMRMVDHENQLFGEAGTALQRHGPEDDLAEQMVDVVEQAVADATAPIRLNASRIDNQVDRMGGILNNQAAMMSHQFYHLEDHALQMNRQVYNLDYHADSLRKSSVAVECQMDALRSMIHAQATTQEVLNDSLQRGNRLADSFSNMLDSLPAAVARASSANIDAHVQAAVERALREQNHEKCEPFSLQQSPRHHQTPCWPAKKPDHPLQQLLSSKTSGQPVGAQSLLDQQIAAAARDELDYQQKEARRGGIKKMFSKFLRGERTGRKLDDLPPWAQKEDRASSKMPFS